MESQSEHNTVFDVYISGFSNDIPTLYTNDVDNE